MRQSRCKNLHMSDDIESLWMPEEALAHALGVDRSIVKKNRPYAPTGGVRKTGLTIEWNAEAATALARVLELPAPNFQKNAPPAATAAPGEPVKKTPPVPEGVEELTVTSKPIANGNHFPNPHIIKAKRTSGEEVYVRVMNSDKYQPTVWQSTEPMVIKAKKSPAGNWWELMQREPRWMGRF